MRAVTLQRRFYGSVGILLLGCSMAACSNGVVALTLLSAAGGTPDAGEQAGNTGGSGGAGMGGAAGDFRGDPGAPSRQPPNFCDGPWETELEDALMLTLSEAFESGRYCPRVPPLRRPLTVDLDLQWQARATVCLNVSDRGWFRLSRGPNPVEFTWSIVETPTLEDAKKALLSAERESLCREAEQNPFRRVGVAHSFESWSIFLAPAGPEDMQKP